MLFNPISSFSTSSSTSSPNNVVWHSPIASFESFDAATFPSSSLSFCMICATIGSDRLVEELDVRPKRLNLPMTLKTIEGLLVSPSIGGNFSVGSDAGKSLRASVNSKTLLQSSVDNTFLPSSSFANAFRRSRSWLWSVKYWITRGLSSDSIFCLSLASSSSKLIPSKWKFLFVVQSVNALANCSAAGFTGDSPLTSRQFSIAVCIPATRSLSCLSSVKTAFNVVDSVSYVASVWSDFIGGADSPGSADRSGCAGLFASSPNKVAPTRFASFSISSGCNSIVSASVNMFPEISSISVLDLREICVFFVMCLAPGNFVLNKKSGSDSS